MIILWIVFGGFTGWIASLITKNDKRMGIFANIVVGLVGTLLGVWIASLISIGSFRTFSFGGFLIALFGSVVLLTLINLIRGRK
ncbi:MAG: GlsB/YeaQ/YmgE family stress response membrane protein [Bacilli bacterium]